MRRRRQGLECRNCKKVVHKKCSGVSSRVSVERMVELGGWECGRCKDEARVRGTAGQGSVRVSDVRGVNEGSSGGEAVGLKVVQWNCDHLQSKVAELEVFLEEHAIDVALLQETKMRAEDTNLRVRGYDVVRKDRWRAAQNRWTRGGGLVALVRKGLAYQVLPVEEFVREEDQGIELQCLQVILEKERAWKLANIYLPPEGRGNVRPEAIARLPCGPEWLVLGDVNAHHEWWDNMVDRDERGRGWWSGWRTVGWW